jgi:hypothetical protein
MTNAHQDGPPATTNPNSNQQHNSGGSDQPQNSTQTNKSNGHVLPLATQPRSSRSISNLLETKEKQYCQLFYKTPCTIAPCQCQVRILVQSQRFSRSKMPETGTRIHHTQISNKLISYKGVLDLPNMSVCREATYLAK